MITLKNLTPEQIDNLVSAIPAHDAEPRGVHAIIASMKMPRPSRRECAMAIEWLAENEHIEVVKTRKTTRYRRRIDLDGIDPKDGKSYTTTERQKSFALTPDNRFYRVLRKLRDNECVTLWMPDSKTAFRKNHTGDSRSLITITPGPLIGLPRYVLMISIIGSGCRLIRLDKTNQVANLVLAGIPAKLAQVLMDAVHHVFKE